MSFTDDDLARMEQTPHLKVYGCHQEENGDHVGGVDVLDTEQFQALLARLEAAEAIAGFSDRNHPSDENCGCHLCDFIKAWRKAAGK